MEYRPISLVQSVAKLITRTLANRLAGRLDQLVSPNQSAFIKGRFILDNFMLVHHTTKFLHQQKQAWILLKLDINKAFDFVSWPFLLEVLKQLGFGPVWCDIISGLLATSLIHSSTAKWSSGGENTSSARVVTRWPTVTNAFRTGHGCVMSFGEKRCRWSVVATFGQKSFAA